MHRSVLLYFDDILEAIANIEEDTIGITFDEFVADRRRRDAVIRNFQVIGEAIKNLPEDLKERHPKTDWKKIAGFRDVLTHAYFGIKPTILWDNARNKLPDLKNEVRQILKHEESRQ
ncbi:MAG: DUF86 domain-containing protein [Methanoregula sp.]|nr:DUF86 domain-containing protein [Methanoregula sp.]